MAVHGRGLGQIGGEFIAKLEFGLLAAEPIKQAYRATNRPELVFLVGVELEAQGGWHVSQRQMVFRLQRSDRRSFC